MLKYQLIEKTPSQEVLDQLIVLISNIFLTFDAPKFLKRIADLDNMTLWLAVEEEKFVGYKLGYALSPTKYYSWLGGVLEERQKEGIGAKLMAHQHQWCKKKGYQTIQTKTLNKWKAMLILNIKNGFDIIDLEQSSDGEIKIVLEKQLT